VSICSIPESSFAKELTPKSSLKDIEVALQETSGRQEGLAVLVNLKTANEKIAKARELLAQAESEKYTAQIQYIKILVREFKTATRDRQSEIINLAAKNGMYNEFVLERYKVSK